MVRVERRRPTLRCAFAVTAAAAAAGALLALGSTSSRSRISSCNGWTAAVRLPMTTPRPRRTDPLAGAAPNSRRLAMPGDGDDGAVLDRFVTSEDVKRAAQRLNVDLRESISGPWYEMELYSGDRQIGKTSGFAQPWGVLHLETIEVRRFTGYWVAKTKNLKMGDGGAADDELEEKERSRRYADLAKVSRWFGLLLSVSIGCWNREKSPFYCAEAHLLAIKDEEKQHERLVRYYKSLGFQTLREQEELSLQDQVVWGGEGTLMNIMADDFMDRWTPLVRQLGKA